MDRSKSFVLILVTLNVCFGWTTFRSCSALTTNTCTIRPSSSRHHLFLSLPSQQGDGRDTPNEVERLLDQASQLREEIALFENQRLAAQRDEEQKIAQAAETERKLRERYSAVVPILKPDGSIQNEQCDFRPRFEAGSSCIKVVEASLPLGIVLGESETVRGSVMVDEVAEGSHGAIAGIRVGDIIRASTACRMQMSTPTWQLMVGGIGQPKTVRFMYGADNRPIDEILDALKSNRLDPEARPVLLVIERKD